MKNVLITGGSGLVGSHLTQLLLQKGYTVAHLGRGNATPPKGVKLYNWNPQQQTIDLAAIEHADIVVHLAGAGVADEKWTAERKKLIIDSRVMSANLLVDSLKKLDKKPSVVVSASAIGWYGMITTEHISEESEPAHPDFFGECCKLWEQSIDPVADLGVRLVKLRIGIVLARESGFLPKVAAPVRWFAGSPLGTGKQWIPWIHIDDLCAMFLQAIEQQSMQGVYNAAGPQHNTNKEVTQAIGKAIGRPVFLPPVPGFALKFMLGEMAQMILNGNRISNKKILSTSFEYKYKTLDAALKNLLAQ